METLNTPDQQDYRASRGQQYWPEFCTSPLKHGPQHLNRRKEESRAALEKTRLLMRAARDDRHCLFRAKQGLDMWLEVLIKLC